MNNIKNKAQLSEEIKTQARNQGFNPIGIAIIPGSDRLTLRTKSLERWLAAGHQADMNWMEAPRRQNIESLLKGVKSILAVGLNYYVDKKRDPKALSIARYAWGRDYHKIIEQRLKKIGQWLEKERPSCRWKICVDSAPLLDKAWAEEAGLGWIGKNSNLINQKHGSWMALGHLLCTEPLIPDERTTSLCGACEICIKACPTSAITEPFVIDSNQCLAYHTIENRNEALPMEIKQAMGSWVVGCDICQDICPWNKQDLVSAKDPDLIPKEWILTLTKDQVLDWNQETWNQKLKGSALKRIKPWMWRRNAKATKLSHSSKITSN